MPPSAFLLLIAAAFAHSAWNFLAKRASAARHLIWFASVAQAVLMLPLAIWSLRAALTSPGAFGWKAVVFLAATGILHVLYFEALQRGYRAGDLSVVYPLARGSGPLISFFGAILLLGERPSAVAVIGVLMVGGGILTLAGGLDQTPRAAIFWGVMTGVMIAAFTLTDAYSVKVLLISPILVEYAECLFRMIALSARGWQERAILPAEARQYWREALGIAILLPTAYIFVLMAMRKAPVTQVAPMREISMLLAAWFGSRYLNEGRVARRLAGSALIAGGVAALAIS